MRSSNQVLRHGAIRTVCDAIQFEPGDYVKISGTG
jgi:hypothetical protein